MSVTPSPGLTSTITTGGTAQNAVAAGVNGGYITNPASNTDQGIGTAENLYVNPVGAATTAANGTTIALGPGQTFELIAGSTLPVSVNALSSGHRFSVVVY